MFRGLMFEAEAAKFRSAGIRLGADDKRLQERYKLEWWTKGIPAAVQKHAESRQKDAEANS
jgi:hypothetical protein